MQLNRLQTIIFRLSAGNRNVFGIMLLSAAFVILIRIFGPLRIAWDLSIQLEAAYRLVQGSDLTNAFSSQFDLNQPPISEYLIHFPPGLSLLVAAFLFFQVPLGIALKIIYTLATIVGSISWSVIGSRCLFDPIKIGSIILPIHLIIAAALLIFYTPFWTNQGTDIFLWAGTPIIILLLLISSRNRFWPTSTVLAGLGVGLLLSFRYASGFLLLAAFFIILYFEWPKWKTILIRYTTFILSSFPFIIPMVLYINWIPETAENSISNSNLLETHGARYLNPSLLDSIFESSQKILASFSNLYILTGIQTPKLGNLLLSYPKINYAFGLLFLGFIISLCLKLTLTKYKKNHVNFSRVYILIPLLFLLISFILFSIVLTFLISYSPLTAGHRYYLPVQPCLIFIAYRVITLPNFKQLLKQLSIVVIVAFMFYSMLLRPIYYWIDSNRNLMSLVVGSAVSPDYRYHRYPSNEVLTYQEESLNFLAQVENQESEDNLLFFLQNYPEYMKYANFKEPLKFRRISDNSFWNHAYLSQSTKVFWVVNNKECPSICASGGNFNSDKTTVPIQNLTSLPNLETVFTDPFEETKIMVSDLPAGYQFGK